MIDRHKQIIEEIQASIAVKQAVMEQNVETINRIIETARESLQTGHKLLLFGNGGSAADSQHIAAEFVSRFVMERQALPAIALTVDTSILTATGNDYHFDRVFARQIEALGQAGDVAWGISTSGNSPNVLKGMEEARRKGLKTIAFTGESGGKLKDAVDICLMVPSRNTARIQESHIMAAHIICGAVERELCG
ncbi:MAG: D-sedoheptulose 7-phosphate isomerase [Calditrichaceae bacterium]|nr:D-sedoheptulose 7-phosphate isomerase [Calditrichia bacterium]NUQ41325.1 D-sedoheptulose 7-phosphate isomerase [Calditrichaceae bacterium]